MRRFEDKVVLVTGSASGIGRATVLRTASEGANVLCVDIQREGAELTAKSAVDLGVEAEARVCDVSDPQEVASSVQACIDRFGKLDVLCNIAGILRFDRTLELELENWNRILAVNLTGTLLMCQAALPHLLETRGNIVNASSTAALSGLPYGAAYGASKAGVLALTRTLAIEYGRQGLRANAVCPGSITTPMTADVDMPSDADPKLIRRVMALDRPRGPETVAGVIAMLASEDGAHVNGEHIRVDGATLS